MQLQSWTIFLSTFNFSDHSKSLSILIISLWLFPTNTTAQKIINYREFLGLSLDGPEGITRGFQKEADIHTPFWVGPLDCFTISITNIHLFKGLQMDNLAGSAVA